MSEVGAVQIPVYNRSDPALWFIMCESTFKVAVTKPITESVTKFNYVVSHLPPEVASLVRDILMNPDATDPYSHLKTELINRRDFLWTFLIADISTPIIGADFLHYFELVPDVRNKCLRDPKTKLQSLGHLKYANLRWVQISISKDTIYHKLLKEFPSITKLLNPNQPVKHTAVPHIVTKGPPVLAKPRRLAPELLKIAKSEFQNMMHLGHLRPSKSNYASPLHMVPKKGALDWRPVGDYRPLNSQTLKDKYPIPCIADFTAELHG
ncbi:hypothetical protein AVEN_46249-1 [Araneus ventricosus]|uniref:DUF7041 domain-containing protein n=1 Tax=Araneus ventricosus TaxID=182803 RepID=A0A4Y2FCG4_ARAVE|nr:hypothetical protein AVEN_46249-1 [Araneus ventricosus]